MMINLAKLATKLPILPVGQRAGDCKREGKCVLGEVEEEEEEEHGWRLHVPILVVKAVVTIISMPCHATMMKPRKTTQNHPKPTNYHVNRYM